MWLGRCLAEMWLKVHKRNNEEHLGSALAGQDECRPGFCSLASDREIYECEKELALYIYWFRQNA